VFFHQEFAAVEQATPVTGYDVVVCQRCGGGYADGIPDQAAFDRYYRDMSKYEYAQRGGAESEYDGRRLALIADIIAPHLQSPEMRILDVGCASGRLLANIRERGFVNVTGLDPSDSCAAAAARLYGVEPRRIYALTFGLGAALAGAAGGLYGVVSQVNPYIGGSLTAKSFAIAIIGGLENPLGVVVGGLFLGIVESLTSLYIGPTYADVASFGILVLVLIVRPTGLLGRTT